MRTATIESRFLTELPHEAVIFSNQADYTEIDEAAPLDEAELDQRLEADFPVGAIVRHPKFGLGRIEAVMRRARGSSARVSFPTAGMKTLILEHAPLERVS